MANGQIIAKELMPNDVGETGGHQSGPYVGTPNTLPAFFPKLDDSESDSERALNFHDERGEEHTFVLHYYDEKDEYQLTHMIPYFRREGASSGEYLVLRRDHEGMLYVSIVDGVDDLPGVEVGREGAWSVRSEAEDTGMPDEDEVLSIEEDPEEVYLRALPEGAKTIIEVNQYERSETNRRRCIEIHGLACSVCGMNFGDEFGEIGSGFIEVHHVTPLAQLGGSDEVDPRHDMVPICPNCHRMLHRRNPPYSVEEMRKIRGQE